MDENIINTVSTEIQKPILVKSITLLKKIIIDMNKIEKLISVKPDKFHEGKKVYFFEYDSTIQEAVDTFIKEKKEKYGR